MVILAFILGACAPAAPATPVETEVVAPKPTEEVATDNFDLNAQGQGNVEFQGWQFATDVVQDNVDRYNEEMGGNVIYSTIAGDYSAIMESKLLANAPLDLLYGHVYDAVRYYEGGWAMPINELPNYETEIKPDLYPHIADYFTYEGQVLGLSYFTSVLGIITVNLDKLAETGLTEADYPKTWDEMYDQLYLMRDAGIEHPYLPSWYIEQWGMSWSFLFEVYNRGGMLADPETFAPALTVDGAGGETLRDWKRIFNDGLVEEEVLSYKEADFLEAWESGRYVYSPTMAYNIKRFNDPEYSAFAGNCSFIPYQGQPWGMIDAAVYIMTKDEDRTPEQLHDVQAFASWYGFRDQNQDPFVAKRWLKDFNLFSAYKSVMESPEAQQQIGEALSDPSHVDELMEIYETASYPKGVFNVVWSAELQTFLKETLNDFLLNDLPVEDTINAINAKIDELNTTYGISP